MRAFVLSLLLWLPSLAAGQEIVLDGPDTPLQPREYSQILVTGLADADLTSAVIDWTPREGTTLIPARLWGGQPFLLFSGKHAGRYTITVSTHAWRANLDAAVDAARRAGQIDADSLAKLVALQTDLGKRYPHRSATCEVEVAGENPTPPPPPPPPVTAIQRALILLDSDLPNPDQALQLNLLRNDPTLSKKIEILDRRTETEDEVPAALVASALQYLAGRPLPRLLGLNAAGGFVFDVELPRSAADITAELSRRGMQ